MRILESGKFLLVGSGIRENFAYGFRNPGLWNPEYSKYPTKELNLESKFHWKRLESSTRNPESNTVLYSLTLGDSTGLWTANYYFNFIYLPMIRSPHLNSFVNEISVRSFLPFADCFFLLRVVSFCFHASRDSLEFKVTFELQPVNEEVGKRK